MARAKYREVMYEVYGIVSNGMNEEQLYEWMRGLGFVSLLVKRKFEVKNKVMENQNK